jgi:2-keto-4-pentenoate hydratase/2-oxohepta-3-ene-1,7-dioic acid hydratase in catechol pathway
LDKNDDFKEKVIGLKSSNIEELLNKDIEELVDLIDYSYSLEDIKILTPTFPSKVVCVGLNYKDHAEELNMDLPDEPILFLKPPSSIIGHEDEIIYPKISNEIDYEGELAVVISKTCKSIESNMVNDFIGGYTILNDVTARDIQRKDGQWTRAKSFDTFSPIGPFIENDMNPMNQNISLKLNGMIKQNSNTKNMIFSVFDLVEFVSNVMTLNPGDIIATGTPPGVGHMNKGDVVEIAIENIGVLKNSII